MRKYLVLLALSIGLVSCGDEKQLVILDNPTEQTITCSVDGKDYELQANTSQEIEMT